MKKTILYFTGLCAVLSLLFIACSKDDNNDNKPDTVEPTDKGTAEQLTKDILGKWNIEGSTFLVKSAIAKTGLTASASKRMASAKIAATNNTAMATAFIEFLADGTFIILDNNGNVSTGDYTAKDGQTIDLSGLGSIKDIKFVDGSINCVIHYIQSGSAKTLTIKARKAVQIPNSDRTNLLCRTWQVERYHNKGWDWSENGIKTWNDMIWENGKWNGQGDASNWTEFEKFVVYFSPSGTYFAQINDKQGKLIEASVEYWKWHPNNQNKFITWRADENEPMSNFDDFTANITELTQSKLVTEVYGDDDDYQHVTFKAVK